MTAPIMDDHNTRSDFGTPPRKHKRYIEDDDNSNDVDVVMTAVEDLPKQQQQQSHNEDDSVLASAEQEIYQQLVESVCIHMTWGIHRSIKNGGISWAELLIPTNRHELFPTLYSAEDEESGMVTETLDKYATEKPPPSVSKQQQLPIASHRKDSSVDYGSVGSDATSKNIVAETTGMLGVAVGPSNASLSTPIHNENSSNSQSALAATATMTPPPTSPPPPTPTMQTRSAIHQLDIWGRCPPKEPKQLVTCSICGRQVSTSRFAPHLDKCMGVGTSTRAAAAAASAAANQAVGASGSNLSNNNNNNIPTSSNNHGAPPHPMNIGSSSSHFNMSLVTSGTSGVGGG